MNLCFETDRVRLQERRNIQWRTYSSWEMSIIQLCYQRGNLLFGFHDLFEPFTNIEYLGLEVFALFAMK